MSAKDTTTEINELSASANESSSDVKIHPGLDKNASCGTVPKLDLDLSVEHLSLSKRKLLAAKMQDTQIVADENKVLVKKMSTDLVNAAFKDVAREIWLNTPRAEK